MKKPVPVRNNFPDESKTRSCTTAGAALSAALRNSLDAVSVGAALGEAVSGGDAPAAPFGLGETVAEGIPADGDVDLGRHHAIESTMNKRTPQRSAR